MRPRNQAAREQLLTLLARQPGIGAAELSTQLAVSVPTLHRMLAELQDRVVSTGRARRTRYAMRRALRGDFASLPLFAVDTAGRATQVSELTLLRPQGACLSLATLGWPAPGRARDGWWDGLPYPLHDMRPQGYLGRQLARAEHERHRVSPNPDEWGDDEVVHMLGQVGSDCSGCLILGNTAFEHWQRGKLAPAMPLTPRATPRAYAVLAEQAVAGGVAGSSAAGEFPKFPALRDRPGSATPHVLVKFSGAGASAAVRRWSDLLVCEHLALQGAAAWGAVQAATTRIVQHEGRTFLESERFDRHGLFGRSALISLFVLDAALVGAGSTDWRLLATRLCALGLVAADDVERVRLLWWYGRLIANTDMHLGNLSFSPRSDGTLALSPAYDMLPMLYAPLPGGELPAREFDPPLPLPAERAAWDAACAAAAAFWREAAQDTRISAGFRRQCQANARRLDDVRSRL